MNRQEIIAMAIEACNEYGFAFDPDCDEPIWLDKFADLVIANDRKRLAEGVELPEPVLDSTGACISIAEQIRDYGNRRAAAEREACAQVCDALSSTTLGLQSDNPSDLKSVIARQIVACGSGACAAEIRAMGV